MHTPNKLEGAVSMTSLRMWTQLLERGPSGYSFLLTILLAFNLPRYSVFPEHPSWSANYWVSQKFPLGFSGSCLLQQNPNNYLLLFVSLLLLLQPLPPSSILVLYYSKKTQGYSLKDSKWFQSPLVVSLPLNTHPKITGCMHSELTGMLNSLDEIWIQQFPNYCHVLIFPHS